MGLFLVLKTGISGHNCRNTTGFPYILSVPKHDWFILENPIEMDDLGVPLFQETSIYIFIYNYIYIYCFELLTTVNQLDGL